jgi:tRNA U34 2-thiouridine synthase MnmA/TrmU
MYTLNDSTNLNIIEKTDNGYSIFIGTDDEKSQKYEEYKQQLWQIENLTKPLRGISSYKVKELREICTKLQLNISNGKTLKKKSILYQMIRECL